MVFIYNVASYICILCVWLEPIQGLGYEDEVSSYEIVEPVHLGAPNRNRRDLSTRTGEQKQHVEKTRFQVDGFQKQFTLYLHKNRYLLPSSFVLISQRPDGSDFIEKGIEHCYYHGDLGDPETTAVAVDTCNGLRGIIKDEDGEEYYIEPHQYKNKNHSKYFNEHVMYRTKDIKLKKQSVCGHNHTTGEYHDDNIHFPLTSFRNSPYFSDHFRKRRAADGNKYIEVIAVLDKRNFNKHKGSVSATATRGVEVMNYVDLSILPGKCQTVPPASTRMTIINNGNIFILYKTMNTRIALTGVIVWNVVDKIHVVESAGKTLEAFRKYCVDVLHGLSNLDPDNVQLLSGIDFEGSLVGLAGVGVMCSEGSCAVNQDHSSPAISANTVAHEMGHNLGFFHNGADCICSVKPCVMNAYSSFTQAKGFTSCVTEKYSSILETGSLPCLFDYPDNLYGEPKCGNGFLEKGEACDCGTPEECKASGALTCCSPTTCKLQNTAQCATGPCCKDCQFKSRGTLCRDKFNEDCDLQEYCTGRSSECPNNFVVKDGTTCGGGTAYCFKGTCDSLDTQCQTLWGPNAVKAHDVCFTQNAKAANEWGNCGKDERKQFKPCKEADILCGKLQCAAKDEKNPLPTFPVIGSHRKRNTVKFPHLGDWLICVMGVTSLGDDLDDPTITPDGTKCGENKLCMDQQCVNITTMKHIKSCAKNCLNGGICNSNGHCHCQPGYACPYCQFSGPGGSLDSGQGCMSGGGDGDGLEDCGCLTPLVKGMLILFLLVIPLCVLIAYLCYRNRALVRKRYDAYRHQPQRSRSASSKGLKGRKAQESRDTGVRGETQQDNPYITYAEPSAPTRSALHPPKKFPAREPPSPRPTNVQTSSSNIGYKPNLPAIGGSSPRVAKLPPIKTDSTNVAGKQWPPAPSYKPYR